MSDDATPGPDVPTDAAAGRPEAAQPTADVTASGTSSVTTADGSAQAPAPADAPAGGRAGAHEAVPAERGREQSSRYTEEQLGFLHEVTTMALYVSLSLLAVLIALPDVNPGEDNRFEEGLTVLGTGLGLVLAHHVAFRMSTRLVR